MMTDVFPCSFLLIGNFNLKSLIISNVEARGVEPLSIWQPLHGGELALGRKIGVLARDPRR